MPGQKFGAALFPGLVAAGLGACGVLLIAAGMRQSAPLVVFPDWLRRARPRAGVVAVLVGLLLYILLADKLGFHLVGAFLLVAWMRVLGAAWISAIPLGLIGTLVIHLAFYQALRVPLPWGVFERWAF